MRRLSHHSGTLILSLREDQAPDLMSSMIEVLDARKIGDCVRLELAADASPETQSFLCQTLEVGESDVFSVPGPLDLSSFMKITDLKGFEQLRYEPWPPQPSPDVDSKKKMFEVIARRDVMLLPSL